ncbi:acylphosphatase [Yinghuangia aomiensis]
MLPPFRAKQERACNAGRLITSSGSDASARPPCPGGWETSPGSGKRSADRRSFASGGVAACRSGRVPRVTDIRRVRVLVSGLVQGVYFRVTCAREAAAAGVAGWVRNLPDDRVEAVFEGDGKAVDRMLAWARRHRRGRWCGAWRCRASRPRALSASRCCAPNEDRARRANPTNPRPNGQSSVWGWASASPSAVR